MHPVMLISCADLLDIKSSSWTKATPERLNAGEATTWQINLNVSLYHFAGGACLCSVWTVRQLITHCSSGFLTPGGRLLFSLGGHDRERGGLRNFALFKPNAQGCLKKGGTVKLPQEDLISHPESRRWGMCFSWQEQYPQGAESEAVGVNSCCTEAENVSTPTPSFSNHRFYVSCSYFLLIGKVSGPHMYWTILRPGAYVYFYSNPSGF